MDYFVRPPVSLTFVFENPIWVSNICLETQVGQQKTKGIQLFVNGDLDNCIARNFSNNPENKEIKFQNFAFPGNKIDFDKDQNKVSSPKKRTLGHFFMLKNAPDFVFLENLGQHFFFQDLLTFRNNLSII